MSQVSDIAATRAPASTPMGTEVSVPVAKEQPVAMNEPASNAVTAAPEATPLPADTAVPAMDADIPVPGFTTADFSQVSASVSTTGGVVLMPPLTARPVTAAVASPPVFAPPSSGAGAVGGGVMALLLVVGLILALAWLAKRMPGVGAAAVVNPALRVVGSLALGPRERVVVVEVGQTQLLLSIGAGGTRALHTLTEPLPATDASPSPFASLLAQHFGKKS